MRRLWNRLLVLLRLRKPSRTWYVDIETDGLPKKAGVIEVWEKGTLI